MYPARELNRLEVYKAALRRRIGRRRSACVAAAARVTQPLAWLDRMLVWWRRIAPFVPLAGVPLAFLWKRPAARAPAIRLRWLPLVTSAVRLFNSFRRPGSGDAR